MCRLSKKVSAVLFRFLTKVGIYWQTLVERTKCDIWQTVRPVTFALIHYMRTDKQDMTKLIVAFFSYFRKTPNVIFEKDVQIFSLKTYLVSANSSQTSTTALNDSSAVLTAEDSFLFCSTRRVLLEYYSGNNFQYDIHTHVSIRQSESALLLCRAVYSYIFQLWRYGNGFKKSDGCIILRMSLLVQVANQFQFSSSSSITFLPTLDISPLFPPIPVLIQIFPHR